MKYTLEQLREMILPMIQSMPIKTGFEIHHGELNFDKGGRLEVTTEGDAGPVADAIIELIKQDREAQRKPGVREDSDVATA